MPANSSASEHYYQEALAAVERRRASCDEILSALSHAPSSRTQHETALATAVDAVSAAVVSVGSAPHHDASHHVGAAADAVSIAVRSVGAAIDSASSRADSAVADLAARSVDAEDAPGAPPPLPPVAASVSWAPLSLTGWLGRNGEDEPPSVALSSSPSEESLDYAPILSRFTLNADDFVADSARIGEDARNVVGGSGQESEAQSAIRQARQQRLLGGSDVEEDVGDDYDLDDAMRRFRARYEEYEENVSRIRSESGREIRSESGREIRMARSAAIESEDSDEERLEASLESGARLRWHTASGDEDDDERDDDMDRRARVRDFATRISVLERTLGERDGHGERISRDGRRDEGDERPAAQRGEGRGFFQRLARGMARAESDDSADGSHEDSAGFRARMDMVSAEIEAEIAESASERDFGAGESDEEGLAGSNLTAADSLTPAEYRRGQLTNRAERIRQRVTTFLRIFRALREDVDSRFYSIVALQQRADRLVGELFSNLSDGELRCLGFRLDFLADMADDHLDAMQLSWSERYGYDFVRSFTTANANGSDGYGELNEIAQMERSSSSGDVNDDSSGAVAEVNVLNLGESGAAEFSSESRNVAVVHGVGGEDTNVASRPDRARLPHLQAIAAIREARAIREVPSTDGLRNVVESLRMAEEELSQEMELSSQLAQVAEGFSLSASRTHFPWRPSPSDVESSSADRAAPGRTTNDLSSLPPRLPRPTRRTSEQPVAPSVDLDNLSDLDGLSDDTLRTMASVFRRSSRRATDSDSVAANDGRQSSFLGHDLSPSRPIFAAPVSVSTLELSIPSAVESANEGGQSRKIVYCSERKVFSGSEWIVNVHVSSVRNDVGRAEAGSCAVKRVAAIFLECCGPGPGAAQGSSSNSRWSAGEMCFSIAVSTAGDDGCGESEREYCHEFAGSGMESNDWGGRDFEVGSEKSTVLVTLQVPKTVISMERTLMKTRREGSGLVCQICMEGDVDQALVPCGHTFCQTCVTRMVGSGRGQCAQCRGSIESNLRIYL